MKVRIFTTSLFLAFLISHHTDAQRLIKKMAGDACDCITDLATSRSNANPNELMEQCLELVLSKYEKKLRREYGDEFFNSSNTQQSEDLGLQIAKQLVSDCSNFLDLIVEDESASGNNAEGLFERGNELFNQGRHQEAIDKYSEALKLEPENHSYYNSRGVVYFDQGKYYYAISDFINAIRWKSNFALGFYNLAYSKYYLNDVHAAHEDINTSLLYDDGYCDAYNLKGLIYNQLEKPDSALLSFRSALECDATRGLYAFNIGYVQYSQQNYADAIANFRKAIELGYEDSNVFSYLGNSYNGEERYDEALKAHKDYISRNSDDYVGYYNLGLVYQNKGEYQNAVEAFEKALEKDDSDPDILYKLGQLNHELGNAGKAEFFLSGAIEKSPENAEYYDTRAAYYATIEEYQKAIEDAKRSLQLYPNDCNVYMLMSNWYKALGDDANAEASKATGLDMGCEE